MFIMRYNYQENCPLVPGSVFWPQTSEITFFVNKNSRKMYSPIPGSEKWKLGLSNSTRSNSMAARKLRMLEGMKCGAVQSCRHSDWIFTDHLCLINRYAFTKKSESPAPGTPTL